MKHGLFKRSISMLLALVMILGNLPLNALATENGETTAQACEHSYEAVTTDATCTAGGYTTHTCALCGDSYTDGETPAKGHAPGEGEVTLPTCTEDGYTTFLCGACGETYTDEETAALGHAWDEGEVTVPAACTAKGTAVYTCTSCGATEDRAVEALGHAWGQWTVTTAATVAAEGEETRACEKCGAEEKRPVAKLEPAPVEETTAPTEDPAVVAVQEMIDALPTQVNSEEEAYALEDAILAVDDALAELYTEQSNQLDYTNYVAALEALEVAFNTDWSKGELANPAWDVNATNPYIINVGPGEADDITIEQLYTLLDDKWDTLDTSYTNKYKTDRNGGFKYGETQITKIDTGNANLNTTTTYTVSVYKDTSSSYIPSYNWVDDGTFKVVEAEAKATIELKDANSEGVYEIRVNQGTYEGLRDKIIAAVVKSINGGAVETSNAVVSFHHKLSASITDWDGTDEWLVLSSDTLNKYIASEDKTSIRVHYDNSDVKSVTISLTDERTDATVNYKTETIDVLVNGYYGPDTPGLEQTIYNAIVTSSNHNGDWTLTVEDTGLINGWVELDSNQLNTTNFAPTQTKNVKISWSGSSTYYDKTIDAKIKLVESRSDAVTVSYTGGTIEADTKDAVSVDTAKVSVTGTAGAVGTIESITYKSGTFPTEQDKVENLTYTVKVKANENYVSISKDITVPVKLKTYTITWDPANGSEATTTSVGYGLTPTAPATDPTKADSTDGQFSYTFKEWTPAIAAVTGEATYTAAYTETTKSYTIFWDTDGDGDVDTTTTAVWGTDPLKGENIPAHAAIENKSPNGWAGNGNVNKNGTIYGIATYTAQFSDDKVWTVTFKDGNATLKSFYVNATKGDKLSVSEDGKTITRNDKDGKEIDSYTVVDTTADNKLFNGWDKTIAGSYTADATYTAQWVDDKNNNNVNDAAEIAAITVEVEGSGTVSLKAADGAFLTKTAENAYTLLFNTNAEDTKVVNIEAKPNDTVATDGSVGYVVSNPGAVTVKNGDNTISVKFGTHTLGAQADEVKVNKYHTARSDAKALETLRTDILKAAGLDPEDNYVVSATVGIQSLNITATVQIVDGKATVVSDNQYTNGMDISAVLANELSKGSYPFTITLPAEGNLPEVSQTLTIGIADSRAKANIVLDYEASGFNTYADFEAAVKNAVKVTDSKGAEVTDFTTEVKATENGTYTATVTATTADKVGGENWAPNTATFEGLTWTVNQYSITFVDEDDTVLKPAKDYDYGTAADDIEKPVDPTKAADAEFTYTFVGWTPTVGEVKGDVTYKATYEATTNEYTITWVIGDNSETTRVAYGKAPTHAAPEAPENSVFAGWKDEKGTLHTGALPEVTGEATYTAEFTADTIYVVTFVVDEETKTEVRYNVTDEADKGVAAIVPADKIDLIFDAWYTDEACTKLYTFGAVPTADITLYAKWIPEANDNNVPDEQETVTVTQIGNGVVAVDGADQIGETDKYLFNSTKAAELTVTATPAVENGISKSFVSSITYQSEAVELKYGENFAVTAVIELGAAATLAEATEISYPAVVITFEEAGFEYNDSRELNYYDGMDNVANKDVYNAIVKNPVLNEGDVYTIQYKAREAMTQEVSIDSLDFGSSYFANLAKSALKEASIPGVLENGKILFNMDALWLDIDVESGKAFPESVSLETAINANLNSELVEDLVSAYLQGGTDAIKAEIEALRNTVYNAAMYYEAHSFGFNDTASETVTEEIKITYKNAAMYIEGESDITLKDLRTATSIVAEDISVVYNSYTDEDLLAKAYVAANGAKIEGAQITCTDLTDPYTFEGKNVSDSAYKLVFKFKGNETYKPSEKTVSVTVTKAPVKVNADHLRIQYNTPYDLPISTSPAGVDTINFIVGLNVSDVNVDDKMIKGIKGDVQLMLPKELQSLLTAFDSVLADQGLNVSFADGASMSLSDLKKASDVLADLLKDTDFAAYTDTLVKMLESLPTDVADIEIIIGGDLPTDIGVYMIGAVTADSNYETAVGAAIVAITPDGIKAEIDWVNDDENNIFTNSLLTGNYLDAHVVSVADGNVAAAEAQIVELFLGVDVDGTITLTTDETELDVGAYFETALVVNWGNQMYYSNVEVRPVIVIAESLVVDFVDETGAVNNERLFEFDNTAKDDMERLLVTYKYDGEGYKAGDKVENYNVKYLYVGTQSNGMPYAKDTAPVHAGMYTITAIVTLRDGSMISHAGVGHGLLTITPTESDISVGNKAVQWDGEAHGMTDEIVATSKVPGLTPDTTIISAGLSANLDEVTGLDAINGNVNVDMPGWLDDVLVKLKILEAGYGEGIKAETFISYVDQIEAALAELEIEVEAFDQIVEFVKQIPVNTTLTFHDDAAYSEIGAYLYVGIVTDSDHYPSVGAGIMVIYPDADEVELKFEEDWNGNNIFTWQALENMNLEAGAYDLNGTPNAAATEKVINLYFGFTDNGEFLLEAVPYGKTIEECEEFDNGVYTQMALLLDVSNQPYYAEPITRAFVIAPNPAIIEFIDDEGKVNADRHFIFDNQPHEMPVRVTQNGVEITNPGENLKVRYVGVQSNGELWNSAEAPVHAGAYTVTAVYTEQDEQGRYVTLGTAVGAMVIEPAASTMEVESKVHVYDGNAIAVDSLITAGSAVEGLNPDKTVITAAISTDGTFSENLMSAVTGSVNVDFPAWVDEVLTEHAPSIYDGMKTGEFNDKLVAKLNSIIENAEAMAEQYNIPAEELISTLTAAVEAMEDVLNQMPGDVNLTFQDDISYSAVGAYLVVGVVTDSDHYPAVDAGVLAIVPQMDRVYLKWNYEDENNIWTRELLKHVDLYATAYEDEEYKVAYGEEAKITYQFIGINSNGELKIYNSAENLPNGIYTEIAYVELEIGSEMVISDVIERTIIIMPNMGGVEIVDAENRAQNKFEYTYGEPVDLHVTVNGQTVENDIYYVGVNNHALPYGSTTAPSDPGIYMATTVYKVTDDKGNVTQIGTDSAMVTIAPGENDMQVTGSTVTYDGMGHGVSTKDVTVNTGSATNANYTLISGGVHVSGDADEIGIQAFSGNVNVDFPAWLDDLMEKYDIDLYTEGTTPATVKSFLNAHTQDIVDLVPAEELIALGVAEEDVNAAIDALTAPYEAIAALLDKLPQDVTLTYEDDVLYTEPGYYSYFGIITDLDEVPSADTGLLVIDKIDYKFGAWHEVVPYDGQEHTVYVPNDEHGPVTVDYVTMIVDRQKNNVNFLLEEDLMYVLDKVEQILNIEIPNEISIAALREKLGSDNIDTFADVLVTVLDKVMAGMEVPDEKEIGKTTYGDLLRIKEVLTKLPDEGTITINGKKPVDVGVYEFYLFAFSEYYKTKDASAVLFIEPIRVVVDDIEDSKIYGANDPELTATVTYYSIQGREDPYTFEGKEIYETDYTPFIDGFADNSFNHIVVEKVEITTLPSDVKVTYDVVRDEGENVGEYDLHIENADVSDSVRYVVETVEDDVFTITPRKATITVANAEKFCGDADPAFTATAEGVVQGETLEYTISRKAGEAVGEYEITATLTDGSAVNANYEITVVPGTLTIKAKDDQKTGFQIIIEEPNGTIKPNKTVEIDGVEYKLDEDGELWISKETAEKWMKESTKLLTTYVYKEDNSDVHKEYPTAMYVWVLTYECGSDNELETVRAVRIKELDNYLMYEGTSIRINFVNDAIRFFTSVTPNGYKGLKNGTLVKNTGTVLDGGKMLEMGTRAKKFDAADTSLTIANSAGDIVFGEHANDDGLATDGLRKYGDGTRVITKEACYLFTGAMENLPTSKENLNLEFVVRPYVTIQLKNGETVTLYGGKYQRTISYVAYQNQTFMAGTAYNDYIQKIIKISGIDPKTGKIS